MTSVTSVRVRALGGGAFVALMLASGAPAQAALTEAARLSAVYDTILQARFDEATRQIAQACPPAPVEGCQALSVASIWWQIVLDPYNRSLDDRFEIAATGAIAATAAWTRR